MNRKRVLETGAAIALVLVVAAGSATWLHRWLLDQALVKAVWGTRPGLVRELLRRGADPNTRGSAGRPLDVQLRGLFPNNAHPRGDDPYEQAVILSTAAGNPSGATAKALLRGGANPNAVDGNGQTALIKAAAAGYLDIAQIMIRHGADVNAQDGAGLTALMHATRGEHVEVVRELLRSGARMDLKSRLSESVLDVAQGALERTEQQPPVRDRREVILRRRKHCEEIIRLLKAAGSAR